MSAVAALRGRALLVALPLALAAASPALSLQPGEQLDDPALEARARDLGYELRCMVCQNQSIDDSDAPLAKDLRLLVRERLKAGDSDSEVLAFLTERYGDFVLLRPRFRPETWLLWLFAPAILVVGLVGYAVWWLRSRRRAAAAPETLSQAERDRLDAVLAEDREAGRPA
jgi:cytochrome c-type biogenesis protein CcmH